MTLRGGVFQFGGAEAVGALAALRPLENPPVLQSQSPAGVASAELASNLKCTRDEVGACGK